MPNTPDHKVAMHQLAQKRLAAGQPIWDRKIRLGDVFHHEGMSFAERRDEIARRLLNSSWLNGRDEDNHLRMLIDELANTDDADEFDCVWDQIYDEADYDRVWITTR